MMKQKISYGIFGALTISFAIPSVYIVSVANHWITWYMFTPIYVGFLTGLALYFTSLTRKK